MVTDDRWEVKVGRNAFTMDLSLLKQWVREGRVEMADQVRPLDGDWVNAGDCPPLMPHFKIHQLRLMRTTDEFAESSPKRITNDFGTSTTGDLESPTRTTGDLLAEAMGRAGTHATTGDLFEDEGAKTTGDLFKEGTRITGEFASPTESLSASAPTRPITREFATPTEAAPIRPSQPVRRSAARPKPPATAPLPPVEQPAHWLEHPLTPLVSLFLFFPAGLVFLWNNRFFPAREKWTLTGITFLTIGALVLASYLTKPFDPVAERLKTQVLLESASPTPH